LVKWLGAIHRYGAIRITEEKEQKAKSGSDIAFHLVSDLRKKMRLSKTITENFVWPNFFYTAMRGWLDGVSSFPRALQGSSNPDRNQIGDGKKTLRLEFLGGIYRAGKLPLWHPRQQFRGNSIAHATDHTNPRQVFVRSATDQFAQ